MSIRDILQDPAVDGVLHLAIALGVVVYCLVGFRRAGHRLRYGIILPIGVVLLIIDSLVSDKPAKVGAAPEKS